MKTNDALDTMGTIHDEPLGSRDAVHVAVLAATAGIVLEPGQHVSLDDDGVTARSNALTTPTVGVVDPFLDVPVVQPGETFWLFVYPRTITGLQHVWEHPSIPQRESNRGQLEIGGYTIEGGEPLAVVGLPSGEPGEVVAGELVQPGLVVTPEMRAEAEEWLRDNTPGGGESEVSRWGGDSWRDVVAKAIDGDIEDGWGSEREYLHVNGYDASGEISDEWWRNVEIYAGQRITRRANYWSCAC